MPSMSEAKENQDDLLTYKEAAKKLGCSVPTLRRMVREKKIPVIVLSNQFKRFHYPTVLQHIKNNPSD